MLNRYPLTISYTVLMMVVFATVILIERVL